MAADRSTHSIHVSNKLYIRISMLAAKEKLSVTKWVEKALAEITNGRLGPEVLEPPPSEILHLFTQKE